MAIRKLKNYKPTIFKADQSFYDKDAVDMAVNFINCLKNTKGEWIGKNFDLIDWQEQMIRDTFGIMKPNGYRQFNTAYVEIAKRQGKHVVRQEAVCRVDGNSIENRNIHRLY